MISKMLKYAAIAQFKKTITLNCNFVLTATISKGEFSTPRFGELGGTWVVGDGPIQ